MFLRNCRLDSMEVSATLLIGESINLIIYFAKLLILE